MISNLNKLRKSYSTLTEIFKSMKHSLISIICISLIFLFIGAGSSSQVPTNGLVAFYPFNGNANDESGNGNNGSFDYQLTFTSNSAGTYAQFMLKHSYYNINIPDNSTLDFSNASGLTFSFWLRDDNAQQFEYAILSKGEGGGTGNDEFALKIKQGQLSSTLYSDTNSFTFHSQSALMQNRWYHILLIWEKVSGRISYYIDGTLENTIITSIKSIHNSEQPLLIGFLIGAINDLRIYNRSLNETEIAALYAEGEWPLQETEHDTITDFRDGKNYNTVKIGNQWWMAENVAYISDLIDNGEPPGPKWFITEQGVLYYGHFAGQSCPCGWHLPSYAEWDELATYLGGREIAGGKLKDTGTSHWHSPNAGATNESGFKALPVGIVDYDGYHLIGEQATFWSSSGHPIFGYPMLANLSSGSSGLDYSVTFHGTYTGYSVRCIKDNEGLDSDNDGIPNIAECIEYNANLDSDHDGVRNALEDLNQDGDYTNDDTDGDGLPNFIDNDDDGDGNLTADEDSNQDGDPTNDDNNNNGIPDYLEPTNNQISELIAHYPLYSDGNDITSHNDPMTLVNAPFLNGGIYSNGIYHVDDPANGCTIITPSPLNGFNINSFTISADFMLTEISPADNFRPYPVFVGGNSHRWVGFCYKSDGNMQKVCLLTNNNEYTYSDTTLNLNQWYNAKIIYDGNTAMLFLDNQLICSKTVALNSNFDYNISTTNYSNARVLKGYFKELKVYNDAEPFLSISASTMEIGASENSQASLEINSNVNWMANSSQTWLTLSNSFGSGNAELILTAEANTTGVSRTATVTVSAIGLPSRIITVTQHVPTLLVEPAVVEVSSSAGSAQFHITSNINWTATSDQSWCLVTASGSGNSILTAKL